MLTVRATLKNGLVQFQPPFTPPTQEVEVLVTFVDDEASSPNALAPDDAPFSLDKYNFAQALDLTKEVRGTPLSQIVVDEREDNWR